MNFTQTNNGSLDIFGSIFSSLPSGTVIFIVIVLAISIASKVWPKKRRRSNRSKTEKKGNTFVRQDNDKNITDPKNQLEYIAKVGFKTQKLLNKEEYPLLRLLENAAKGVNKGLRVMAQTSLGEVLTTTNEGSTKQDRFYAFRSINSKRLDFAIFDRTGTLILAVEYQGSGHYQAKSFIRDAVKREAVRKAGVQYLEIPVDYDPAEASDQVSRALFKALRIPFPVVADGPTNPDVG